MNFGRVGRQELLDLAQKLLETTLLNEWEGSEHFDRCPACGAGLRAEQHPHLTGCRVDIILIRCGYPDQASREAAREALRNRKVPL